MAKEKLLMTSLADGVELYPYFHALIGVGSEEETKRLLKNPPTYDPEKTYYLALPFPIISPKLFIGNARMAVALDMPPEILREICIGQRVIALNDVDGKTIEEETQRDQQGHRERYEGETPRHAPMYYRYRDCLTVRGLMNDGLYGFDALHYLCERYLGGMTLSEESVVAIRVHSKVVLALALDEDRFLQDPLCEAYAKVALRIARLVRLYHLNAPRIICQNERIMLAKAVAALAAIDPFTC